MTVIAKPSEELMKSISDADNKRVEERKKTLGKKGLKELMIRVENAIQENDVTFYFEKKLNKIKITILNFEIKKKETEVPDVIFNRLKVPSLENVEFRKIKQHFTYDKNLEGISFEPIKSGFQNFKNLKHLQMQVDHLENTKFVQV